MKRIFINGTGIFLGAIFFTSGMAKVFAEHKFPGIIGPVWLEDILAKHDLGLFAQFIAYAQIGIGFLLLTLRFATVGAIMLLPMNMNILMITVSQNWVGTPYVISFFIVLNVILLLFDFHKWKYLFYRDAPQAAAVPEPAAPSSRDLVVPLCMAIMFATPALSRLSLLAAYIVVCVLLAVCFIFYFRTSKKIAFSR
jgi:hypothetical protein